MQTLDFTTASPAAFRAMMAMEGFVRGCGIETPLLELVRLRASQINGCAYCVDMHTSDARKGGETERRLQTVCVWQETPFFTPRERAALAWTETLTRLSQAAVPHGAAETLRPHFSEQEMVDLTLAIISINGWNRLALGFGKTLD